MVCRQRRGRDVDLKFNYLATRVAILIKRSYIYKYKRLVTSRVYISLGMASAANNQSLATTLEWPVLVGYLGYFLRVLTNLTSYMCSTLLLLVPTPPAMPNEGEYVEQASCLCSTTLLPAPELPQ